MGMSLTFSCCLSGHFFLLGRYEKAQPSRRRLHNDLFLLWGKGWRVQSLVACDIAGEHSVSIRVCGLTLFEEGVETFCSSFARWLIMAVGM